METVFVDTVAWIALANKRDSLHETAQEIFENLWDNNSNFLTSEFVVLELGNALSSVEIRLQTADFIQKLQFARSIEIVPAASQLFNAGLLLFRKRVDKDWGLIDCTSFVIMNER